MQYKERLRNQINVNLSKEIRKTHKTKKTTFSNVNNSQLVLPNTSRSILWLYCHPVFNPGTVTMHP